MPDSLFDKKLSRRDVLKGSALAAGTLLAAPVLAACGASSTPSPAASAAAAASNAPGASSGTKQIFVKSSGGSYQDATKKAVWDPFTQATGIEVVPVNIDSAPLLASIQQGQVQVDVDDEAEATLIDYQTRGALEKLDYNVIGKSFNASDVSKRVVGDYMIGKCYWASVLAYRTDVFPNGTGPQTWMDFWNADKFPGARAMQDANADLAELEFAQIASGMPADPAKLYPIDIAAALKSMSVIRPKILKFWTSGAQSAELLDLKEVVMTSIWNGRAQTLIDSGRPVAISWTGARRQINFWAVPKGAPHRDAAMKFIDFALQPKVQADFSAAIAYAPTNQAAQPLLDPALAQKLGSTPDEFKSGFDLDVVWWAAHLDDVVKQWTAWSQS